MLVTFRGLHTNGARKEDLTCFKINQSSRKTYFSTFEIKHYRLKSGCSPSSTPDPHPPPPKKKENEKRNSRPPAADKVSNTSVYMITYVLFSMKFLLLLLLFRPSVKVQPHQGWERPLWSSLTVPRVQSLSTASLSSGWIWNTER